MASGLFCHADLADGTCQKCHFNTISLLRCTDSFGNLNTTLYVRSNGTCNLFSAKKNLVFLSEGLIAYFGPKNIYFALGDSGLAK